MNERRRAYVAAMLIALIASLAGFYIGQAGFVPEDLLARVGLPHIGRVRQDANSAEWGHLDQVRRYIQDRYVEPVADQILIQGAIDGLVKATGDRYSIYMSPQQYTGFLQHFQDHFGGVGIRVEMRSGYVTVVAPIPGSPGDRAGLKSGDRVVAVDDLSVEKLSLDEVVPLIRGPVGSKVRLSIQRGEKAFVVELERADIPVPQAEWKMLPGDSRIGYLHIYQFNTGLHERIREALTELRHQGMRALILDLRQNPGGLLNEAVEVSSLFIPRGPVVHIVSRDGQRQTYRAQGTGFDLPLVVLVDEGSASAAEIVAGAIRDRGRGVLLGTRTFGKGSVQSFFDLPNGAGLKLTTARYLTAGGHSIHGEGIEPHVVVVVPADLEIDLEDPSHPQVKKAAELLREQLACSPSCP